MAHNLYMPLTWWQLSWLHLHHVHPCTRRGWHLNQLTRNSTWRHACADIHTHHNHY